MTLVRSATIILNLGGVRLLVDPMLDDVGARPPVENTDNDRRNPLVPLPLPIEEIVRDLDAILVTHLHRDHFDDAAAAYLPRDVPLFCQPEEEQRLRALDFDATPLVDCLTFQGLRITRTRGQHGTGEVAHALERVSGFVIDDVYLAGDTIWYADVEEVIARHRPRVAIVNGSGARFIDSDPLVMTTDDIREACAAYRESSSFTSRRSTTAPIRVNLSALRCRRRSCPTTARRSQSEARQHSLPVTVRVPDAASGPAMVSAAAPLRVRVPAAPSEPAPVSAAAPSSWPTRLNPCSRARA
jgi:L-ascorbate metabolism protein UlaG (beta-lactamase superfamily)